MSSFPMRFQQADIQPAGLPVWKKCHSLSNSPLISARLFWFPKYFLRPEEVLLYICRPCCLKGPAEKDHSLARIKVLRPSEMALYWNGRPLQSMAHNTAPQLTHYTSYTLLIAYLGYALVLCKISSYCSSIFKMKNKVQISIICTHSGNDTILWCLHIVFFLQAVS